MKKFKIKGIIISAILFGVFAAVSAGLYFIAVEPGSAFSDWDKIFSTSTATEYDEEKTVDTEGISKININLAVAGGKGENNSTFTVIESEDENVYLLIKGTHYAAGKNTELKIKLEKTGAVLTAEVKTSGNIGFSLVPFNVINFFVGDITVQIPATYTGELKLNISAGSLEVDVANNFAAFEVDMSAGTVKMTEVASQGAAKLKLSAGTLNCDKITASSLNVNVSAGTVKLGKVVTGALTVDISAGTVNIADAEASGKIYAKASAGTITIKATSKPSEVELKMSAGTINFTHNASISVRVEYNLSAGRLRIYGDRYKNSGTYNPGGELLIKVSLSAGTCNINK